MTFAAIGARKAEEQKAIALELQVEKKPTLEELQNSPKVMALIELINAAYENPDFLSDEKKLDRAIKIFSSVDPEATKEKRLRTRAINALGNEKYKESLRTGQPANELTEAEILNQLEKMRKKQKS